MHIDFLAISQSDEVHKAAFNDPIVARMIDAIRYKCMEPEHGLSMLIATLSEERLRAEARLVKAASVARLAVMIGEEKVYLNKDKLEEARRELDGQ